MTARPIPTQISGSTAQHPIEDPDVQLRVKRRTAALLAESGGCGKVSVTYHFNRWKSTGESVQISVEYPKVRT